MELLRDHAVEKVDAVSARDFEHGPVGLIEQDAPLAERGVLELKLAEGLDQQHIRLGRTVRDQGRFGLLVELAEGADAHDSG